MGTDSSVLTERSKLILVMSDSMCDKWQRSNISTQAFQTSFGECSAAPIYEPSLHHLLSCACRVLVSVEVS